MSVPSPLTRPPAQAPVHVTVSPACGSGSAAQQFFAASLIQCGSRPERSGVAVCAKAGNAKQARRPARVPRRQWVTGKSSQRNSRLIISHWPRICANEHGERRVPPVTAGCYVQADLGLSGREEPMPMMTRRDSMTGLLGLSAAAALPRSTGAASAPAQAVPPKASAAASSIFPIPTRAAGPTACRSCSTGATSMSATCSATV